MSTLRNDSVVGNILMGEASHSIFDQIRQTTALSVEKETKMVVESIMYLLYKRLIVNEDEMHQFEEAMNQNKSLNVLSDVIDQIADGDYRT
jgi:hypothetical protein